MHEIHKAFVGKNLLSKYGFSLPKLEPEAKEQYASDSKVKTWSYDTAAYNYVKESTAEVVS